MNVPKLRFKEFDGEWEEKDFEELLEAKDGIRRGPFGSALKKEFFVPESDYVIYEQQNAIYDKYTTRYNITKDKYEELIKFSLKPGDFIMSGSGTIGRISKVPKGIKKGVFNQALIRFRINSEITDSEYFLQFIRAEKMQRKLTGANPGSAITNLVPMSELKKWSIITPNIKEQQKISKFLKTVDKKIQLQQQKIDLLQEQKKGFLQKIFHKEVCFNKYNNIWSQKKLEDVAEFFDNLRVPITSTDRIKGLTPYYGANGIQDYVEGYTHKGEFVLIAEDGANDVFDYPVNYVNGEMWVNNHAHVVKGKAGELDNLFLAYRIKAMNIYPWLVGGSRAKLNGEILKKIPILLPSYSEQQRIGKFFAILDKKIQLQKEKLELLQKQKQGFMQQMFI